jgi:RNA polymerase sigma-70 factor (ECF subfamily)
LEAQLEARDLLRTPDELLERHREILLAVDQPETLSAYARQRWMSPFTAAAQILDAIERYFVCRGG